MSKFVVGDKVVRNEDSWNSNDWNHGYQAVTIEAVHDGVAGVSNLKFKESPYMWSVDRFRLYTDEKLFKVGDEIVRLAEHQRTNGWPFGDRVLTVARVDGAHITMEEDGLRTLWTSDRFKLAEAEAPVVNNFSFVINVSDAKDSGNRARSIAREVTRSLSCYTGHTESSLHLKIAIQNKEIRDLKMELEAANKFADSFERLKDLAEREQAKAEKKLVEAEQEICNLRASVDRFNNRCSALEKAVAAAQGTLDQVQGSLGSTGSRSASRL